MDITPLKLSSLFRACLLALTLVCLNAFATNGEVELSKHHKYLDVLKMEKFLQKKELKKISPIDLRRYLYQEYRFNPKVIRKIKKGKKEKKKDQGKVKRKRKFPNYPTFIWRVYNQIFIQEERVNLGVEHYFKHKEIYDKVAKEYGIPASFLAAVLGVETKYGTIQGKYNVRNTLITNSFHKESHRQSFYQRELVAFLQLAQKNEFMHQQKGSYAGALGMGQFIPSSYKHYAVDYNGDGWVDLFNSEEDAIASIANYFIKNRWRVNQPVAKLLYEFESIHINSKDKVKKMNQKFKVIDEKAKKELKGLRRIAIFRAKKYQLWGLFYNFRVIKRYNNLNSYAMTIHQLSERIGEGIIKAQLTK